jgi:hypothetical protein
MKFVIKDKIIRFINKRIFKTPGVEFLRNNSQSIEKKKKYLNFWIKKSRKNIGFRNFFFNNNYNKDNLSQNVSDYKFDAKNNFYITNEMFDVLKKSGILIIENALPHSEMHNVIDHFAELKNKKYQKSWINKPKSFLRDESELEVGNIKINEFKYLKKYSEQATKNIYTKIVDPSIEMHYLKLKNIEEKNLIRGETFLHSDRFLPHFKMFYSPFKITKEEAPFQYAVGSHVIDENYFNFFLKAKFFDETDDDSLKLIKKIVTVTTNANTLYLAFTNGLHKRSFFNKKFSDRSMMFFQYVEKFNKFNYLFPSN